MNDKKDFIEKRKVDLGLEKIHTLVYLPSTLSPPLDGLLL